MHNILLLGNRSEFTAGILGHLARAGIAGVCAGIFNESHDTVARPARGPGELPVTVTDPLAHAAHTFDVRLTAFESLDAIDRIRPRPDLIVTACFPRRLPASLLHRARAGGLNVHPSLLPAYRGPTPIFWQLRAGERTVGVTVHRLSDVLDGGDIVAAKGLPIRPGLTARDIDRMLVDAGGRLLTDTLARHPWDAIPHHPQDESRASYFSWPRKEDFRVCRTWPAERAYRFMRGTAEWCRPWVVDTGDALLHLERAITFDGDAVLPTRWQREGGDRVAIAFKPGVLRAVLGEVSPIPGG